jgi:hypothetical protein
MFLLTVMSSLVSFTILPAASVKAVLVQDPPASCVTREQDVTPQSASSLTKNMSALVQVSVKVVVL